MRDVSDVEFRRFTVNKYLPRKIHEMRNRKEKVSEQLTTLLDVLAQDWDEDVVKGAKDMRSAIGAAK